MCIRYTKALIDFQSNKILSVKQYYYKYYLCILKQVYKTTLDGNSKSEILPLKGLALPVGLAWDWLGENLYVADQDSARIDLYSLSTGFQRNILSDNIQSPTCIALDPTTG